MPVNRQTVRELSRTTLYNITSSGQAWRAFLDAAARLYKYSFPEQVLIYAQEPEATACAAKEVWYTRMKRSLRPDAQAIALPDPHSHFGRLKYVFDVRETQPLPGAPEFRQWSLPFEALERVTDRLGQEYGISREPVVADRVYALVMNAPRELYPMQLTAMLRAADAEGRWSGQDDAALARQFHQLVADSAAYMVGVRVGIGTGAVTSDALESITRFNSSGLAALAGTYASRLAASVLRDVERAARENDRLAFPARGVQNEGREEFSHAAEAAKEVQDNDIYNTERSALPGPDAEEPEAAPGKYGLLRLRYLEKSDPDQLNILLLEGALNSHLAQIDRQVRGQVEQTMERLVQRTRLPDKQTDPLGWAGTMNSLRQQAEETAMELIYGS